MSTVTKTEDQVAPQVQVGTIFYSSWGYDQTNVDWYQVVARTKACVRVRRIGKELVSSGSGSDRVMPRVDAFLEDEAHLHRLRIGYRDEPAFNLTSYSDAYLWDGTSQYETSSGWGH